MTAEEVRALLNAIVDPCSLAAGAPAGIDEMGLVRDVEVEGLHRDHLSEPWGATAAASR